MKKILNDQEEFSRFYDRALKFLSYRPRSEKELLNWFKKKKVGEKTQALILLRLKEQNLINDEEFARWWIEQRTSFRPLGKRAITIELRRKGIPNHIISQYLSILVSPSSEYELAKKAAEKKMKAYKSLPPLEFRQKLSSFLARRGFSWETIEEVAKSLIKSS